MTINALNIIPVRTASCSVMGDYAIKAKMTVPYAKAKKGDIVLYDFNRNGTSDHTGLIVKVVDGKLYVVEGNTSEEGSGGSDSNGGMVAIRTRTKGSVNYVVRPKYTDKVTADMVVGTAMSQVGIKEKPAGSNRVKYNDWYYGKPVKGDAYPWCMTYVEWLFAHVLDKAKKPTGKYAGKIPTIELEIGAKGAAVKQLQQFLTWYGIKTDDDGDFGRNTLTSLIIFQMTEGLTPDGVFGKKSQAKAKAYLKTDTAESAPKPPETTQPAQTKPATVVLGKCIDVSYWQGKITLENWKKIRKTCEFAICRASYTNQREFKLNEDSTFQTNFSNAKAAGLKVGAYHYSQAVTVAEAKAEAEYMCLILKKYSPTFYVVCDFEYGGRLNSKIGKKASDIANAFCDVVKAHGYQPCIYANTSTLNSNLTNPKYPVWVAQYNDKCTYTGKKVMWQYTSKGRVDGIDGKKTNNGTANVDLSNVYALPATADGLKEPTKATQEPKGYEGKFPTQNTNAKIVNGMAVRMCWPYGTPEKEYTFKDGKPTEAYKNGIDKVYPNHKGWPNKKQKVGACCDVFVGVVLGLVGVKVAKDLKNQLIDLPKMTKQLKFNGHYLANDFDPGDVVQRGRKDRSGHTWVVCEVLKVDKETGKITGVKYVANSHYKHLNGCYAVMDAKPKNIVKSKWAYYKCYTVLGAIRTYYMEGDYGWDIVYIQKFLNWCKLKDKNGKVIKLTVDGDFGKKTGDAVEAYQKLRGLTVDRIVGDKTMADMKKVRKQEEQR